MRDCKLDGDLLLAESADLLLIPATGSALERTLQHNAALLAWLAQRPPAAATGQPVQQRLPAGCRRPAGRAPRDHPLGAGGAVPPALPGVRLQIDELFTEDANRFCSGGAQAGLDLCLQLIARHAGDWLAQRVAGALVVERERGGQRRFAPLLPLAGHDDPLIGPLLHWLQLNHAQAIDLARLAERAHCSPRTLLRRFKAATGLTPNDYLQRLRISAAQSALRNPARSLEQIAAQVGYADRATFAKLFKQLCGETPGAFRKRLRQPLSE